jgi:flagellum-specific peptidoglycan hydrolase FlgJ
MNAGDTGNTNDTNDTNDGASAPPAAGFSADWTKLLALKTQTMDGQDADAVKRLQAALGVHVDGVLGSATCHALQKAFADLVYVAACASEATSGIPAAITAAQAILETGYGTEVPKDAKGTYSFNLFGIKAAPGQSYVTVVTHEYIGGVFRQGTADFAAYGNFQESLDAHAELLTSSQGFRSLFAVRPVDLAACAAGLKNGGYATDPEYDTKLLEIIARWNWH